MDKKRIPKLVIVQSELDRKLMKSNLKSCYDCNSQLFYVEEEYGVVIDDFPFKVMGNKDGITYRLAVINISIYCAECGSFLENYFKLGDEKDIVYTIDRDLDEDEKVEIEYCLHQFNQKGDFKPRYKFTELNSLKEALKKLDLKGGKKNGRRIKTT
jgi:hypothetical protein